MRDGFAGSRFGTRNLVELIPSVGHAAVCFYEENVLATRTMSEHVHEPRYRRYIPYRICT